MVRVDSKAATANSSGCTNRFCKLHAKATTTVCQERQTSASSQHTGLTHSGKLGSEKASLVLPEASKVKV